jgi:hypothetical protein
VAKSEEFPTPDYVVLLVGYSRPDMFLRRLKEIALFDPMNVMISIDFHSDEIQQELAALAEEHLPSALTKLRYPRLGLANHIKLAISDCLDNHDFVIVVEDDVSVCEPFFESIISYLPHMKSLGVASIGGYSPLSVLTPLGINPFVQTKYFSSWGWATSREVWSEYELDMRKYDIEKNEIVNWKWKLLSGYQKRTWQGRFRKLQTENPHTWDIQFQFMSFKFGRNHLLPIWPLVYNEGFDDDRSSHTIGGKPNWMGPRRQNIKTVTSITNSKFVSLIYNFLMSLTIAGDRKLRLIKYLYQRSAMWLNKIGKIK